MRCGAGRVEVGIRLQADRHRRTVGGPAEEGRLEDLRARVALGRDAGLDEFDRRVGQDDLLGFDRLRQHAGRCRAGRRRHGDDQRLLRTGIDELGRKERCERSRGEEQQGRARDDPDLRGTATERELDERRVHPDPDGAGRLTVLIDAGTDVADQEVAEDRDDGQSANERRQERERHGQGEREEEL